MLSATTPLPFLSVRQQFQAHDHLGPVVGVADDPHRSWIVSCGSDGRLLLLDRESGERLGVIGTHRHEVRLLAVVNPELVVTSCVHGHGRSWKLYRRRCVARFDGIGRSPVAICVEADGRGFTVSAGNRIAELDFTTGRVIASRYIRAPRFVCASAAGDARIVLGLEGGMLAHWDMKQPHRLMPFGESGATPSAIAVSSDRRWLCVGRVDGSLTLFDFGNRREVMTWMPPHRRNPATVTAAAFAADRLLVTGDSAGHLSFWTAPEGRSLGSLRNPAGVSALAVSADGRGITTGLTSGRITQWEFAWTPECDRRF